MGNKLCKKKGDLLDGSQTPNRQRSFKGIISKWNLKPKWKSDSHLNKQRCEVEEKNIKNSQQSSKKQNIGRPLSKSSDWTDVPLVAATDEADHNADVVYVKNAPVSLIFNDDHTPTPPPRKHHKKPMGFREKIKAVAKQGLQAVQSSNSNSNQQKQPNYSNCVPVEEPICVKKIINYNCPHCEAFLGTCHRHRAQEASQTAAKAKQSQAINEKNQNNSKSIWNRKASSSSTNSLPTQYGEGKLSIAIDDLEDIDTRSSIHSLPGADTNDGKQAALGQNTSTPNDIMSRARSFGSLFPQMLLHKLSTNPAGNNTTGAKAPLAEIESDDSFGGLEDWDVGLIEHYNPKDASLPRGVKMGVGGSRKEVFVATGGNDKWRDSMMSNEDEVLATLEGMIINDIDDATPKKPEPPQRKTESLLKKITRENSKRTTTTTDNINNSCQQNQSNFNRSISTPPPSPEKILNDPFKNNTNNYTNHTADHSTLMKIIEDYKQDEDKTADKTIDLYRNLSTEEALVKSISKTTSNVDTVTHSDITRKSYMIEDDLSKFDSPNVNEFKRMSVTDVNVNNVNPFGKVDKSVASMHNDFLNAERQFVTELI